MIDLHLYAAFVAAVITLMLIPGPNVALIVANSVAHGPRYGLLTVAGTSSAMVLQLGRHRARHDRAAGDARQLVRVAALDRRRLSALSRRLPLASAADRSHAHGTGAQVGARDVRRALLVSLANPKTLLFYGAFFPQFLSGGRGRGRGDRAVVRDLPGARHPGRWRLGAAGGAGAALPRHARPAAQPAVGRAHDRRWYRPGAGAQELVTAGLIDGKGAHLRSDAAVDAAASGRYPLHMTTHLQQRIDARIIGRAPIGLPEAVIRVSNATLEFACHVTL